MKGIITSTTYLLILIFMGLLLGDTTVVAQANESCAILPVTPMDPYNLLRSLGTWYPQQYTVRLAEDVVRPAARCLEQDIYPTLDLPYFKVNETSQSLDGDDVWTVTSGVLVETFKPAHWHIQLDDWNVFLQWVYLHTDYSNYGMQYTCMTKEHYRYEGMVILTRERNPSRELIDELQAIIVQSYGFPAENVIPIDQSGCVRR